MGGTEVKTKGGLGGFADARKPASDTLSDGLQDTLGDRLAAPAATGVAKDAASTSRQLRDVAGAPGTGPADGETDLSGLIGEATADHAADLS